MADALILEVVTAPATVAGAEIGAETVEDPGKAIPTEITAKVNKLKELPQRRAVESDGWAEEAIPTRKIMKKKIANEIAAPRSSDSDPTTVALFACLNEFGDYSSLTSWTSIYIYKLIKIMHLTIQILM
jgi:hypothetical protein